MGLSVSKHRLLTDYLHHRPWPNTVDYLLNYRLQWGKPDRLSLLPSKLDCVETEAEPLPEDAPLPDYFTADIHPSLVSIIQNDWPYSGVFRPLLII